MHGLTRVEGTGDAIIHKGDPRAPKNDIDAWWNGLLGSVQPATRRPWLYGSDAGLCPRKNVFYSQNDSIPFQMQPSTRAYMATGVALENLLADGLSEKGRLICQNPYLIEMPEVKVRGKIDLVVFDHEDELALIEVKSCGELPNQPNVQHLAQIQTYCAISGIHRAWLTYISRKVQDQSAWGPNIAIRTFKVETEPLTLTNRLFTAVFSDLCIKAGKLPLMYSHFRKTEECRYCSFLDFCWKKEPRYGGDGPDSSFVEDLSITEELNLTDKARNIAEKLYQESEVRRHLSISKWLEIEGLSSNLKKKLKSLL